jgi:hypothetical protein
VMTQSMQVLRQSSAVGTKLTFSLPAEMLTSTMVLGSTACQISLRPFQA